MTSAFPPRRLILFTGSQSWGHSAGRSLIKRSNLQAAQIVWLKENDVAIGHLGQDKSLAIMDAYTGMNPDVFGRLSGTLIAGGAMVLIIPLLDEWSDLADPYLQSIQPYSKHPKQIHSHYINRWVTLLKQFEGVEIYDKEAPHNPAKIIAVSHDDTTQLKATAGQEIAIKEIIKAANGQRRKPAIICADRGRGKSTALGMAAAILLDETDKEKIIVTASGRRQTKNLFSAAERHLKQNRLKSEAMKIYAASKSADHKFKKTPIYQNWRGLFSSKTTHGKEHHAMQAFDPVRQVNDYVEAIKFDQTNDEICCRSSTISYASTDTLLNADLRCDFLIIEEAASIGIDRLSQLLIKYSRVAIATTEHGYEGSGRGFSLKFRELAKSRCRGIRDVKLTQPIRWAENDPLEAWTRQLLLLGAEQPSNNNKILSSLNNLQFQTISQQHLASNERLLQEVFACLVNAHYQTRPKDLRLLLDAPNVKLVSASYQGEIIGLIWLMAEGGLPLKLAKKIESGQRRPQGHLIPQILSAHLSLGQAATQKCLRVQRIVVKPQWQRQGIGRWMLAKLETQVKRKTDYLASSFGCDVPLLKFWQKAGFELVRMSDKTNASSGLHSVAMLKPLSKRAKVLSNEAGAVFSEQFIAQLSTSLDGLSHHLVVQIQFNQSNNLTLSEQQLKRAMLFAYADLPYESCLSVLHQLASVALTNQGLCSKLSLVQRRLLVSRVLQNQSWSACEQHKIFAGKAEQLVELRKSVQTILQLSCSLKQIKSLAKKYELSVPSSGIFNKLFNIERK